MMSKEKGSDLMMISKQIIAKLYTSPGSVPFAGGKFSLKISGAVHIFSVQMKFIGQ